MTEPGSPPKTESEDERRKALKDAFDKCSETVNRAMLSLLAVSLFCVLTTLGASDRSLIAPQASIKVPFADVQISFVSFLFVAPILLAAICSYLHLFYGRWLELNHQRQAFGLLDTYPTLFSLDRFWGRKLTYFIFYALTPLVLALVTYRASARLEWGIPTFVVTVVAFFGLTALHSYRDNDRDPAIGPIIRTMILVPFTVGFSLVLFWILVTVASVGAIPDPRSPWNIFSWERPLELASANLTGASLSRSRLRRANLRNANLRGSDLAFADLTGARLEGADLRDAHLDWAELGRANLESANLAEATLFGAQLGGADLRRAIVDGVKGLRHVKGVFTCDELRVVTKDADPPELPATLKCSIDLRGRR